MAWTRTKRIVATVKRTLNRVGSPVILVGHSYGGATITAAGVDERVVGLVYIAAVAPDAGETVQDQLDKYPSDIFTRVEVADGRAWMLPNGTEFFAGDLSEEEQKLVWATHYAPVFDLFHQQKLSADSIAWKSKPSWYVLATQDHTVHPDLQRWVSKRMGATVTEVESSHVPMLSQARCRHRCHPEGCGRCSKRLTASAVRPMDVERLPSKLGFGLSFKLSQISAANLLKRWRSRQDSNQ